MHARGRGRPGVGGDNSWQVWLAGKVCEGAGDLGLFAGERVHVAGPRQGFSGTVRVSGSGSVAGFGPIGVRV